MDLFLKFFIAFVTALNSATGAPLDGTDMPDRPPIAMPTLAPLPIVSPIAAMPTREPAKTTSVSGTITNIQDGFVFVGGIPVSLGPATRINGQLRAGSIVLIEATIRADGGLEADQLDVSEDSAAPRPTLSPTEQPQAQTLNPPAVKPTATLESKSVVSPKVEPTETPEARSQENPEVKPAAQPTAQPTENFEVKTSDSPEVHPTEKPSGDSSSSNTTGGTDSDKTWNSGTYEDSSKSDSFSTGD